MFLENGGSQQPAFRFPRPINANAIVLVKAVLNSNEKISQLIVE